MDLDPGLRAKIYADLSRVDKQGALTSLVAEQLVQATAELKIELSAEELAIATEGLVEFKTGLREAYGPCADMSKVSLDPFVLPARSV